MLFTLIGCVGCDQSSKYTARYFLEGHETISMFGDILRLSFVENPGGFLSLGAFLPDHVRMMFFMILPLCVLIGLFVYALREKKMGKPMILALALIIGGGLGNLIDRVANDGLVIDFLNIGVGSLRTGIFNVADMAVMLGSGMLILFARAPYKKEIHPPGNG